MVDTPDKPNDGKRRGLPLPDAGWRQQQPRSAGADLAWRAVELDRRWQGSDATKMGESSPRWPGSGSIALPVLPRLKSAIIRALWAERWQRAELQQVHRGQSSANVRDLRWLPAAFEAGLFDQALRDLPGGGAGG